MLISDKKRLILMLPQKCASLTLQRRLRPIHDLKKYGCKMHYNSQLGRYLGKHVTLEEAAKLKEFETRRDYLKACFVRNPYDRVYSWFQWIKNQSSDVGCDEKIKEKFKGDGQGLVERKLKAGKVNIRKLEEANFDFNQYYLKNSQRFRPTHHFTHFQNELLMGFIGRVEAFEEDFDRLCEMIDYQPESRVSGNVQLETTSGEVEHQPKYIQHYEPESIALVNECFSDDFEFFGYEKVQA